MSVPLKTAIIIAEVSHLARFGSVSLNGTYEVSKYRRPQPSLYIDTLLITAQPPSFVCDTPMLACSFDHCMARKWRKMSEVRLASLVHMEIYW